MLKKELFQDMISKLYPDEDKSTKTITFLVTDDCPLRCSYCYQTSKGNTSMSFDVLFLLLSNI